MSRTTLNKVIINYENEKEEFLPVMVENCMNPGTFTTYPVEIFTDVDKITIKSLNKHKSYPANVDLKEENYVLRKPGKTKCDGNCNECRKCS